MSLQEARLFVTQFTKGGYTPEEHAAFLKWVQQATIEELEEIAGVYELQEKSWSLQAEGPAPVWVAQLEHKLDLADEKVQVPVAKVRSLSMFSKRAWIAAASVLVILAAGGYYWFGRSNEAGSQVKKEIATVLSNSISTENGQQQLVLLPDGSKVWLNASSTIKYPSSFKGRERNVELSGEAYFEISPNAGMPFRVGVRDYVVEVLGTHFNVMAYPEEPVSRTTLIEGAVKITRGEMEKQLQPGEQAEISYPVSGASTLKLIRGVDSDKVVGWRNGVLVFENDDLHAVMRTLARVYNVKIQYTNENVSGNFRGSFNRSMSLDQVLKILEDQTIYHFTLKDQTIIITP